MKKYISLIVCAALIILSVTVFAPAVPNIIAGRGNGTSAKINTVEEFVDVLEYFNNYSLEKNDVNQNSGLSVNSYEQEDSSSSKYTSVTFCNKSETASKSSSSNGGVKYISQSRFERELLIYMTDVASYYVSKGKLMSKTGPEGQLISYVWNFEMEFYFTQDRSLFKFNLWEVYGEDAPMAEAVNDNMLNLWFESEDKSMVDGLLNINSENYQFLDKIGEYFEKNKSSNFNRVGKIYTLKRGFLDKLWGENINGEFSINLSNDISPSITLEQSYSDGSGHDYNYMYANNDIRFTDINNTVIKSDIDNVYVFEDFIDEE